MATLHVGILGHFGIERRLRRRNVAIRGHAYNHMSKRIPFIPATYPSGFSRKHCLKIPKLVRLLAKSLPLTLKPILERPIGCGATDHIAADFSGQARGAIVLKCQ